MPPLAELSPDLDGVAHALQRVVGVHEEDAVVRQDVGVARTLRSRCRSSSPNCARGCRGRGCRTACRPAGCWSPRRRRRTPRGWRRHRRRSPGRGAGRTRSPARRGRPGRCGRPWSRSASGSWSASAAASRRSGPGGSARARAPAARAGRRPCPPAPRPRRTRIASPQVVEERRLEQRLAVVSGQTPKVLRRPNLRTGATGGNR